MDLDTGKLYFRANQNADNCNRIYRSQLVAMFHGSREIDS